MVDNSEQINPVNMSSNIGINDRGSTLSLAKQILMDCEGEGNISLPKSTLKIVLMEFINGWKTQQQVVASSFAKVAR